MPVRESPFFIGGGWVDGQTYTHAIPFGGFKESGLGREGGRQGIEEYVQVKSISLNTS